MHHDLIRALGAGLSLTLVATACGGSEADPVADPSQAATPADDGSESAPATDPAPATVTLLTHDSFNVSENLLADFTEETGITIEILRGGDAGAMVNQAILTADEPLADVLFGVDTTFLSRAINAELFLDYDSPTVGAGLLRPEVGQPQAGAIPIDVGHVCLNYDRAAFEDVPPPSSLEDLTDPVYADQLVVQNPASSSPGLAFLLTTVAAFGEDGWLDYWEALVDNGVEVTSGWEDAYYGRFSGGSGEGDRPLVVSYSSSPPAEVLFGPDPEADEAPTGVLLDTCYQQVEYAGILRGTTQPDAAAAVVEFLLSEAVQADVPTSMFVFPAREGITLPDVFERFAEIPEDPWTVPAADIEAHRDAWIEAWTDTVLR